MSDKRLGIRAHAQQERANRRFLGKSRDADGFGSAETHGGNGRELEGQGGGCGRGEAREETEVKPRD